MQHRAADGRFYPGGAVEDNLYLEKGKMAQSSDEQVEKIVRIAREHGLEPATPSEAREILKLKGLEKVRY